jgi:prepilin-type N-terminal cleavage/methylation domain-containing protein
VSIRRAQDGFTLIEVLLAMTLSLVVIAATLGIFATMERKTRDNQRLNEEQSTARVATDSLARRLRNLASPANPDPAVTGYLPPQPLERAEAQDLIFRTVNSEGSATTSNAQNLERYRYCLSATSQTLYVERQTWTGVAPATPTSTTCGPGDGWGAANRRVAAQAIVNGPRPVFKYQVSPTPGTYSEQTSVSQANFPSGIAIRTQLWVDPDVLHPPAETTLNTRVFLRNQNRPPIGTFSATGSTGSTIILNASESEDPEGNALSYQWLDNGAVIYPKAGDATQWTSRSTYVYAPLPKPTGSAVVSHSITLKVRDVGNLSPTVAPAAQVVNCTSTLCVRQP